MENLNTNKYYHSLKLSKIIDLYLIIENNTNQIINIHLVYDIKDLFIENVA
ncbi:hypothetical protein [Sulfurimonas sp.]|uniref:hypothetical protein n=1 Tax=Sulfurimonas sp. TaxID=2022749 RepID=UPI002B4A8194|nr:hypothetical protein [Sulfurimonas sp.]